ncbi:hypothetical protein [Sphingomonas azotifigens]|uniref:hypothetical protein n=1 Tax=Sphingomonas azotifigens TaxID=330920 RepID=UPI0009FEF1EB|nr:hypothetical protein [Sphingomonas azotifigens]
MSSFTPRLVCAATILLSACSGGGGSGGGGGIAPAPAPPVNTSITNLTSSQSFTATGSATTVAFELVNRTVTSSAAADQTLMVSYDAGSKSYTITQPGGATSFQSSDIERSGNGETRYVRNASGGHDYLTIATTPYSGGGSNRYVALGYIQHNAVSGTAQNTGFAAFPFGFETPLSAVPRTGTASWQTDVFGLYSAPGNTPRTVSGGGDFSIDFANGLFSTKTSLIQADFVTGGTLSGGGIELIGQGSLRSDGSFAGNIAYEGSLGMVAGPLAGRFYGPGAEEIGASFRADNAAGVTLTGALTGQRKPTATQTNFTLSSIASDQLFYSIWARLDELTSASGGQTFVQTPLHAQMTFRPDGSFQLGTPVSDMPGATFTAADKLPSNRSDFTSYQKLVNGNPVRVDLYAPGSGSQAIVLSYAGFGMWGWTNRTSSYPYTTTGYFTYGFTTPRELLSRRIGTASYDGPAYGTAATAVTATAASTRYTVSGTSHFDIDFTRQNFSGNLVLSAAPEAGGSSASLGTWQFSAPMSYGLITSTALTNPSTPSPSTNMIVPELFGPNGNEIAATFAIANGAKINGQNVWVAGATVAKPK